MRQLTLAAVVLVVSAAVPVHAAECVSSSRAVVTAEYRQLLERAPDPSGLAHWIGQLDVQHQSVEFMTRSFVKTAEYRERFLWTYVVRDAYLQVLERAVDPAGLADRTRRLAAGTVTVRNTIRELAVSPEYATRFITSETPSNAVILLFRHLLARTPTASEINTYVAQAQAGGWPSVVNSVIDSAEYTTKFGTHDVPGRGKRAYEEAVTMMYRHVLARAPESPQVVQGWVSNLDPANWNAFVDAFLDAGEYRQKFGLNQVPGNPPGPHYGTERFQECLDLGGKLELPAGVYNITRQLRITKPIHVVTLGQETRPGNCSQYMNDCAVLTADAAFSANGGMLQIGRVPEAPVVRFVILDHIAFDGNRARRLRGEAAAACRGSVDSDPFNRLGFNASGTCDDCKFIRSASVNALCGTGFEWIGSRAVIEDNAFLNNGDRTTDPNDKGNMWADGLTMLRADAVSCRRNTFVDNTDLDLICGGSINGVIADNSIRHVNKATFGALMLDNFRNRNRGNFTGLKVTNNIIECNNLCDFGINIGPHPWYSGAPNIIGGEITGNTVRRAKQGINVDGAGKPDSEATRVQLYGNTIDNPSLPSVQFRGCMHATSLININTADSYVNQRGDTTPTTRLVWHDCQ